LAHRRKQIHQADLHRPPAKRALKHKHSALRDNSRYAIPFPASAFRRVTPSGSATDNGQGDEPDAVAITFRHRQSLTRLCAPRSFHHRSSASCHAFRVVCPHRRQVLRRPIETTTQIAKLKHVDRVLPTW